MDKDLDIQITEALKAYLASGVEDQVDYQKFYLYSIVTHSTAIEGSTVTEIENQLLFDEGITAKGRSLTERYMPTSSRSRFRRARSLHSGAWGNGGRLASTRLSSSKPKSEADCVVRAFWYWPP